MRLFARYLLMPADWITALHRYDLSSNHDAVITRLAELELPIPAEP